MKKIIQRILRKFGYEINRATTDLPSSEVMYPNFSSLATALEYFIKLTDGIDLGGNSSRTMLLTRLRGTTASEAYYIIKALYQSKDIEGDVCEFGVAQGETSALIANEILAGDKKLHLFDSFQGLSTPTKQDKLKDDIFGLGEMNAYKNTMSYPKNWVISRLNAINIPKHRYFLHEGFIEDVLNFEVDLPQKISFAYVDLDLYAPTKATLEFLASRTESGAIIIIDDYDFFSTGVKLAVDEFVQYFPTYQLQIPPTDFGYFAILRKK